MSFRGREIHQAAFGDQINFTAILQKEFINQRANLFFAGRE